MRITITPKATLAIPTRKTVAEKALSLVLLIFSAKKDGIHMKRYFFLFLMFTIVSCKTSGKEASEKIIVGAERTEQYLPQLENKNVALVVNHTSTIGNTHLLDTLLKSDVQVVKIFAPEHGFRGEASAGATIKDGVDSKTGIPVISLYGKNKKPSTEQLKGVDIVIFDIQDVGARFYTYISTLQYVSEAVAENNLKLLILDRPNPNGHYVAGPVREEGFKSFVGINPIPVVHGLTIGEMVQMSVGEGWLPSNLDFNVIPCLNYDHSKRYVLPIKPSPNLPNIQSVYLYPSICFFEPTKISVGRGTNKQFQVIGGPDETLGSFSFTPTDKPGAQNPVNEGIKCHGLDLSNIQSKSMGLDLSYLVSFYSKFQDKDQFFTNKRFFNLLMGNDWIVEDIIASKTVEEISSKWSEDLEAFKSKRTQYLIYPDFE